MNNFNKPASRQSIKILIVMLCAIAGCSLTFWTIKSNIIAQLHIPPLIKITDGNIKYNLRVTTLDSLKFRSVGSDSSVEPTIDKSAILFHQNPVFLVWILLILSMVTAACGAFPVFVSQNLALKKIFQLSNKQTIQSLTLSLIVVVLLVIFLSSLKGLLPLATIINDFKVLLKNGDVIVGIVITIFLLLVPAMMLMFLIGPCSDSLVSKTTSQADIEKAAKHLNFLNGILLNSLQYLAIIVVLAVLTTSALAGAVKTIIKVDGFDIFPSEFSYAYGLYFSFFLAIMYIPVYLFLKTQSSSLEEILCTFQNAEGTADEKWINKVSDSLSIKNTALDNIKMAFTVISPLITSFLPEQLHFFK